MFYHISIVPVEAYQDIADGIGAMEEPELSQQRN